MFVDVYLSHSSNYCEIENRGICCLVALRCEVTDGESSGEFVIASKLD